MMRTRTFFTGISALLLALQIPIATTATESNPFNVSFGDEEELYPAVQTPLPKKPITINIGGVVIKTPVAPTLESGTTLVPMRSIFEALGQEVEWFPETREVVSTGDADIRLSVGSNTATVNGQSKTLSTSPKIVDDATFVPVRFISESLGRRVFWNREFQTVYVTSPTTKHYEDDRSPFEFDYPNNWWKRTYMEVDSNRVLLTSMITDTNPTFEELKDGDVKVDVYVRDNYANLELDDFLRAKSVLESTGVKMIRQNRTMISNQEYVRRLAYSSANPAGYVESLETLRDGFHITVAATIPEGKRSAETFDKVDFLFNTFMLK